MKRALDLRTKIVPTVFDLAVMRGRRWPALANALILGLSVSLVQSGPAQAKNAARPKASIASALEVANAQARRKPEAADFVDAAQIYDYAPGAIYELYAAPQFLSTILLEEGETLVTSAAGDTTRWMIESAQAAGPRGPRTLILLKPVQAGLRTNLVLVTDRRTYLIEAIAQQAGSKTYSAQVAWRYTGRSSASLGSARVPLEALYFGYSTKVKKGRIPAWMPARVFDDGLRTYVEFGPDLAATDAPPLFVIGSEGPELVNYRVQNNRYVVDQLFDAAELRLGDKKPVIVRIERQVRLGAPQKSPPSPVALTGAAAPETSFSQASAMRANGKSAGAKKRADR